MRSPNKSDVHDGSHWSLPVEPLYSALKTRAEGLSPDEATLRLKEPGHNDVGNGHTASTLQRLLSRFANPLVVILLIAALISSLVGEWVDAFIVMGIILLTTVLGFIQEHRASAAVDALRQRVSIRARVKRSGVWIDVPRSEVVRGDIVELSAGALCPGDVRVIDANACFVDQALLTGESLPVEKMATTVGTDTPPTLRTNCIFMGTSIRSGWAQGVVVDTGSSTFLGGIADKLAYQSEDTEFERGLRQLGSLLMGVMLTVVIVVLAINIVLNKSSIDTLLFAAALAVGLSPELLPAILTITLSHGARTMAKLGVIVKRLNAIENLGSMDVLCTDKTGTLTQGVIQLDRAVTVADTDSADVLRLADLNAELQTGMKNPLDDAIIERGKRAGIDHPDVVKLGENPYNFRSRRLSIIVSDSSRKNRRLICKGAVEQVLDACVNVRQGNLESPLSPHQLAAIMQQFAAWSQQGYRVLAVATRELTAPDIDINTADNCLCLEGFLLFFDPPEPQAISTLAALGQLGIDIKIITGDNRYVSQHVADALGMSVKGLLTGRDLEHISDDALWNLAPATTLFTEIDPNQKERIIKALQKSGHVVGYLGDGINDAPALHAADVGISVDRAADVAKEAADFVLLNHDLDVLRRGIDEGRHTFANTLKYIFITTSANFGNMISMGFASVFLPFLPLLAKQILLNNFLSDIPSMGIAGDNVDREWESTPHRWDIGLIRRSMLCFGLISTVFDLLTFLLLWTFVGHNPPMFRTGWFVESLLSELSILFILRTYRPFYASKPGQFLAVASAVMGCVGLVICYLPGADSLGFVPLPLPLMSAIIGITTLYVAVSEVIKRYFFRREAQRNPRWFGV